MTLIHCHGYYYPQSYTINITSWKVGTYSLKFIWVDLRPFSQSKFWVSATHAFTSDV